MVTDQQVKYLFYLRHVKKMSIMIAAVKAGMSESTAHKYLGSNRLPSACVRPRKGRTHPDAFAPVWEEVEGILVVNPNMEAKAFFMHLQRTYPGRFKDGQLRTFQRRMKQWRVQSGPPKEVYFEQVYVPGDRAQSDFTCMNSFKITIQGKPLPHLLYHFVLAYSKWESVRICYSESFESFSEGLQKACIELGGVPKWHQTDRMSCAVETGSGRFTRRYQALGDHYGFRLRRIQAGCPNENGIVEQRHYRLKNTIANELTLRKACDFDCIEDYAAFLERIIARLNASREERLNEERSHLGALPERRLDLYQREQVRVSKGSTIRVKQNTYSVPSRLIGSRVDVRVYAEWIEVWVGDQKMERMPCLIGANQVRINYRHILHSLVRKPGAFADYRHRSELFPTLVFRRVYDALLGTHSIPLNADKMYLKILHLAATVSEARVVSALESLLDQNRTVTEARVKGILRDPVHDPSALNTCLYDVLLQPSTTLKEVA